MPDESLPVPAKAVHVRITDSFEHEKSRSVVLVGKDRRPQWFADYVPRRSVCALLTGGGGVHRCWTFLHVGSGGCSVV